MNVAVVGAGPAGALLAFHLARDGAVGHRSSTPPIRGRSRAAAASRPRRSRSCRRAPAGDPLPGRRVAACRFESGEGDAVDVPLARPVVVASRLELDAWLLRRAVAAGARHVAERVTAVSDRGVTAGGRVHACDVVVGADGAGSLVRRTFLSPTPPARLAMAAGWFAPGTAPMVVRFTPGLAGYLWLFPRPDHVGVGICAPLAAVPTRDLLARLEREVARSFPALADDDAGRYAHTIPSPSADAVLHPRDRGRAAGRSWATRPRWPTRSPARASTTRCAPRRCWPRRCARTARRAATRSARWTTSAPTC